MPQKNRPSSRLAHRLILTLAAFSSFIAGYSASAAAMSDEWGIGTNSGSKTLIAVPMEAEATWQDLAYLAAVPAGARANNGQPVVVALDPYGTVRPELQDFIRRYEPDDLYLVDALSDRKPSANGLVAHWPINEGNGTQLKDKQGKHDAQLKQATLWNDQIGGAYAFDGKTLSIKSDASDSGQAVSIAFWMKPESLDNAKIISRNDSMEGALGWAVIMRKDADKPSLRFRVGGTGSTARSNDLVVDNAYAPGEWIHVACSFADGTSKVYLNGSLRTTRENISLTEPEENTSPLEVRFSGALDDIRVYERELDFVEVQRLHAGSGMGRRGLVNHWTMDAMTAGVVPDSIGGNHLKVSRDLASADGRVDQALELQKQDLLKFGFDDETQPPFSIAFDLLSTQSQSRNLIRKTNSIDRMSPWSFHLEGQDLVFRLGSAPDGKLVAENAIPLNKQARVVTTYEAGEASLYVDGRLITEKRLKSNGKDMAWQGPSIDGSLDNLQLYGRALSRNEISAKTDHGLLAWWTSDTASLSTESIAQWEEKDEASNLVLNGVNDYAVSTTLPPLSDRMSISLWVKPESTGYLLNRFPYDSSTGQGFGIYLDAADRSLVFLMGSGSNLGNRIKLSLPEAYTLGEWFHIACSYDKGNTTLYLNGKPTQIKDRRPLNLSQAKSNLFIGCEQPGTHSFKGTIADIRLYNQALDEDAALAIYGTTLRGQPKYDFQRVPAESPEQVASTLAKAFWKSARGAIICDASNYSDALVASGLAGKLKIPLLYSENGDISRETEKTIQALDIRGVLFIGSGEAPKITGVAVRQMADASAVLQWAKETELPVDYFAVANPQDRHLGTVRKVSLAAPMLAAGRNGLVLPLDYATEWKLPLRAKDAVSHKVDGLNQNFATTKQGTLEINGVTRDFVMSAHQKRGEDFRIHIADQNGEMVGPLNTADPIQLGDRQYTLYLGQDSGVGRADAWVSWPGISVVQQDLKDYCADLGRHPTYLCILGGPDVIPFGVVLNPHNGDFNLDVLSDFMLANVDDDPFVEMAHGRIVGEDLYSATLIAARGLVYQHLLDPSWANKFGTAGELLGRFINPANGGFQHVSHHSGDEGLLGLDSPLRETATIVHCEHSSWRTLGGLANWDTQVLLAPTLIESSGCSTMRLDVSERGRSVVARMMANGALAIAGNSRNGIGQQRLYRSEFWNALLQGQSIGQAHRYALNKALVSTLDLGQKNRGADRYQLYNRALFGDPAVKIHLPQTQLAEQAKTQVEGDIVKISAPEEWEAHMIITPDAWRSPHEKVYFYTGAGLGLQSAWSGKERCGISQLFYTAEYRTDQNINGIRELDSLARPLGWTEKFWIDKHQDGTQSVFWRVKLIDYDVFTGEVHDQVDRIQYSLVTD